MEQENTIVRHQLNCNTVFKFNDDCPICMEKQKNLIILSCSHIVCEICYQSPNFNKNKCPICRKQLKGDIVREQRESMEEIYQNMHVFIQQQRNLEQKRMQELQAQITLLGMQMADYHKQMGISVREAVNNMNIQIDNKFLEKAFIDSVIEDNVHYVTRSKNQIKIVYKKTEYFIRVDSDLLRISRWIDSFIMQCNEMIIKNRQQLVYQIEMQNLKNNECQRIKVREYKFKEGGYDGHIILESAYQQLYSAQLEISGIQPDQNFSSFHTSDLAREYIHPSDFNFQ